MMSRNGKQRWGSLDPKLLDPTGGQMHQQPMLPGYDGVPYRGAIPNVKQLDPEHKQPQVGAKVHVEILDLSKDEDLKRYRDVCQMIANDFGKISQERIEFDDKKKNWLVFIRWLEMFAYDPAKGHDHGRYR
jgi:hypothetical protein